MSRLKALKEIIANKASGQKSQPRGTTAQQKAEKLNENYLDEILGYNVQDRYEEIMRPRGTLFENMHPLEEAALLGGAGLLLGAGGASAIAGDDEEDYLRWAVENGYVLR